MVLSVKVEGGDTVETEVLLAELKKGLVLRKVSPVVEVVDEVLAVLLLVSFGYDVEVCSCKVVVLGNEVEVTVVVDPEVVTRTE